MNVNTVSVPGFTAEIALQRVSGQYRTARYAPQTGSGTVRLALRRMECTDACCANCTCCANGTGPSPSTCCSYCNSNCGK